MATYEDEHSATKRDENEQKRPYNKSRNMKKVGVPPIWIVKSNISSKSY